MANKVKLGIIGYGHIGSQHGRAIRDGKCPQVDLTAVCDIDPARLELAKKTNGENIRTFTDASELIHSGVCEAVIVAVPHYLHPSMAIEAMETGLHVIVEKPAGVYTKQVERMNAVAAKHPELVYCMDFNQRTNPLYKKVKDLIDSGDLGEMKRVIWIITDWYRSQSYYDQGGWRATWDGEGGGVLLKYNARQTYTTSGFTGSAFSAICQKACVPVQIASNRADVPGGSTLGNLLGHQILIPMVDIGLAQLAMHSSMETASCIDAEYMAKAVAEFYNTPISQPKDGEWKLGL